MKEKEKVIITNDDISDAVCVGDLSIENDVLNDVFPDSPEDSVADVNISYASEKPLYLEEKTIRKGDNLYRMVPKADHPFLCDVYRNGQPVRTLPVSVDWEVTSEDIDANPVYREVWGGRTIYGPDEPIGEELAGYEYTGNIDVRILDVEMPDLDLS